ncbi:hypothetical protein AQPW35_36060 [Rubrivivax pictus]|uniref:Uncharacterized protein n=1 Tax=Pseudaquabacterium pictum TaxID=2315236 RepID=A0A480AXR5_9BURK|nr:hypothetical protein AQPW35_36060 [Rubrivivax pictus]
MTHAQLARTRASSARFQAVQRPQARANQGGCISAGGVSANSRATTAVPTRLASTITASPSSRWPWAIRPSAGWPPPRRRSQRLMACSNGPAIRRGGRPQRQADGAGVAAQAACSCCSHWASASPCR